MREREKKKKTNCAVTKTHLDYRKAERDRVKALKIADFFFVISYYIEICVETVRMLGSCSLTVPGNNNKDLASVTAAVSAAAAAAVSATAANAAAATVAAAAAAIHT